MPVRTPLPTGSVEEIRSDLGSKIDEVVGATFDGISSSDLAGVGI